MRKVNKHLLKSSQYYKSCETCVVQLRSRRKITARSGFVMLIFHMGRRCFGGSRPLLTKRTCKAHKATLLQKSSLSVPPDSFKRVSVHLTTSYESRNSTAIVTHGGMIGDVIICIFVIRFDVLSVIFFRIRDSDSSVLPMEQLLC